MQYEYRVAVAHNNMAIGMIERACYQQATETLKCGAVALQTLAADIKSGSVTVAKQRSSKQMAIQGMLEQAYRNAANPEVAFCRVSTEVISHDAALGSADRDLRKDHSTYLLIRIETTDTFPVTSDYSLISGILLYNLAIASLCQAKTERWIDRALKYHDTAITFLRYSHSLFNAMLYEACLSPLTRASEIGISAIVLHSLVVSLEAIGRFNEATYCAHHYSRLRSVANALRNFQSLPSAASAA